jgi:hypothetical protein
MALLLSLRRITYGAGTDKVVLSMTYDTSTMDQATLITALRNKVKEDMETKEDVHYNEGSLTP